MRAYRITAYLLITVSVALVAIKIFLWDYSFGKIMPKESYEVNISYSFDGYGEPVRVESFMPLSNGRQVITEEQHLTNQMNLTFDQESFGKKGVWTHSNPEGNQIITYSFQFIGEAVSYEIAPDLTIAPNLPAGIKKYLDGTPNIQVQHPVIQEIYSNEVKSEDLVLPVLTDVFNYVSNLPNKTFKGLTDAVTAAQLQEASCNGKSRLFLALIRNAGIPGRLVGGIILDNGQKKTSHQWVEVYVNGFWIPFDATNNHFASLPGNYLELYKDDYFLFSHSSNINFDYIFNIKSRLVANPTLISELEKHPFNAYKIWEAFNQVGIPLGLLKIILMMPLGAFVVALCRNVIGIKTFGVFLPALIGIACRETGFEVGIIAFGAVVGIVSLMHGPLEKWGILYTPKMVIMLVCVVISFLMISVIGMELNLNSLAYVTLFPMVVIAITAEKFARTIVEDGMKNALQLVVQSLVVAFFAYLAMNSRTLEATFLAFPELFLSIIGLSLLLGKWIGIRVTEFNRFQWVIK